MQFNIFEYIRIILKTFMLVVGGWYFVNSIQHFSTEWGWIPLALVYTTVINDSFAHRICAHRMFEVNTKSWLYKVLTWFASADLGFGTVKQLSRDHDLHHIYADQGRLDPMNWRYYWYSSSVLATPIPTFTYRRPDNYDDYVGKQIKKNSDIINDPWTDFCGQYSVTISIVTMLVLYLLFPVIFFKVFLMGRFLLSVITALAAFFGHMGNFPLSYRNYNTNDTSVNNLIFHYFALGLLAGMLQNNHHGQPRSINPNPKWWEIDTSKPFILMIKKIIEKK
jgi:fatty-acid desaturase